MLVNDFPISSLFPGNPGQAVLQEPEFLTFIRYRGKFYEGGGSGQFTGGMNVDIAEVNAVAISSQGFKPSFCHRCPGGQPCIRPLSPHIESEDAFIKNSNECL